MSNAPCCSGATPKLPLARRCVGAIRWVLPSAILALLPKCPACIAAYVALGTGIGLSIAAAATLRTAVVLVCIGALVVAAGRVGARLVRGRA